MRKMIAALVAAGLLFTAACGGDDDDSADAGSGDGGGGGGGEFCDRAVALFSDTDIDDEEAIAQLESIEPPDEIADDWQTLVEGTQAANAEDIDVSDPEAAAEFEEQYDDLIDASANVYNYLGEECDMEGFSPVDPSDLDTGATDSTVTTEAGG
jgi:hypothetical protein